MRSLVGSLRLVIPAVLFGFAVLAIGPAAADVPFGRSHAVSLDAAGARSVLTADLDADGDPDVVAAIGTGPGARIVYYENEDGQADFASERTLVSAEASQIALGDLDGDGDLDLVAALASYPGSLVWYRQDPPLGGEGGLTFAATIDEGASGVESLVVADLDRDGVLDVVASRGSGPALVWYRNGGTAFGEARGISSNLAARALDLSDIDGDGDLDVVGAGDDDGDDAVFTATSSAVTSPVPVTWHASGIGVACPDGPLDEGGALWFEGLFDDFDWLDVALPNVWPGLENHDRYYRGSFTVGPDLGRYTFAWSSDDRSRGFVNGESVSSDLFGCWTDGCINALPEWGCGVSLTLPPLDLTRWVHEGTNVIAVHVSNNTGPGRFYGTLVRHDLGFAGAGFAPLSAPAAIAIGDLDRDGDPDLVAGGGAGAFLYLNDGSGIFDGGTALASNSIVSLAVADLDRDGPPDIVVVATDSVFWLENDGGATFTRRELAADNGAEGIEVVDLDRDGDPDVLTSFPGAGVIRWYEDRAIHRSALFESPIELGGVSATSVVAVDLDRDGSPDLVSSDVDAGEVRWYGNDGGGGFVDVGPIGLLAYPEAMATGDIDRDGYSDIVAANESSSPVVWFENAGDSFPRHPISPFLNDAASLALADLDGDGDLDVVSGHGDPGELLGGSADTVLWWENDGTPGSGLWPAEGLAALGSARSVATGDIDADGWSDVVVGTDAFGNGEVAWIRNLGHGEFASPAQIDFLFEPVESVFPADLDRDGDLDVLVVSASTAGWYENDSEWSFHSIGAIDSGTWIFAADLDADGDADVIASTFDDGAVAWYENQDGAGSFGAPSVVVQDGAAHPLVVAAADLDRDGDLDLASGWVSSGALRWQRNVGGQVAFGGHSTAPTAPSVVWEGERAAMLAVTVELRARLGDPVARVSELDIQLREASEGTFPMDTATAQATFESLEVWRDDGSGAFEAESDVRVASIPAESFSLVSGGLSVALPADDPNVRVAAPATFFVVLPVRDDAATSVYGFAVRHRPAGSSVVDSVVGAPLAAEPAMDLTSDPATIRDRIVVDTATDGPDVDSEDDACDTGEGECSLRAAVMLANDRSGLDRIYVPAGNYAFTLDGPEDDVEAVIESIGDLDVIDGAGLEIVGDGAGQTIIDAAGLDRVFDVRPGAGLALSALTLTGGDALRGGALRVESGAELTGSEVEITGSVASFGGALSNDGTASFASTTLWGNAARAGGQGSAAYNAGTLTLRASTISTNVLRAPGDPSALIYNADGAALVLASSTVTANEGGGLYNLASATLDNTIVAGNDIDVDGPVPFTSLGHNLIGNDSGGRVSAVATDLIGGNDGPVIVADLGPLRAAGLPTPVHRPLPNSLALDSGSCAGGPTDDQRGLARPVDLPAEPNTGDGCDIGSYEATFGDSLQQLRIPVRWCGLRGAPSIEDPSLVGATTPNDVMRGRHEAVSAGVWVPQANVAFRSAANFIIADYPLLEDPDCVEGSPGTFTCAHGERGDVYINPELNNFDEFQSLIAACRAAWQAEDPTITGLTVVQIDRFVGADGSPLELLGLGGRAEPGNAAQQAAAGRVMLVDPVHRLAANPPDTVDRLLGHELGHALALQHGDGLDNDGNGVLDDDDDRFDGLPRFDGPNLMQYRNGTELTIRQMGQTRLHALLTIPDLSVQPLMGMASDGTPLDEGFKNVLDFGFKNVLDFGFGNVLDFGFGNVLDFGFGNMLDFGFANVLDFGFSNVLDFGFGNVLDFGMELGDDAGNLVTGGGTTTLFGTTASLPWPSPIRPDTAYYFYLDLDRNDATGALPRTKEEPDFAPLSFPGGGNEEESGVDLIARVVLRSECPGAVCSDFSELRVFDYDDDAGVYQEVYQSPTPDIVANGVGLYQDSGGEASEHEDPPIGLTVKPVIPTSLLSDALPPGAWEPRDPVLMEALAVIECSGSVVNDDPGSGGIDCQCTDCADCPDYPGCNGSSGTPLTLGGTRIVADAPGGEINFVPPVLPECVVAPAEGAPGATLDVTVTELPNDVAGQVEVIYNGQLLGSAPTSAIDPQGTVVVQATLPGAVLGEVELSAGISGFAPRAHCSVVAAGQVVCDDFDGDGLCDTEDLDDDGDGASDDADADDFDPAVCSDTDGDTCDDCSGGSFDPAGDGVDFESDGFCDAGDGDDDNDAAPDSSDSNDQNPNVCSDTDGDTCDDCSTGTFDLAGDGPDGDADGICNAGDNCSAVANPSQADGDGDGEGDACEPPTISVTLSPSTLWPPNHRMVPIVATVNASSPSGPPSVILVSIVSSEPDNGQGDGNTVNDIQGHAVGTYDTTFSLRAERSAQGSGRIYTVRYRATTAAGRTAEALALARVPLNQNGVTDPVTLRVERATGNSSVVRWAQVPNALYYNVIRGNLSAIRAWGGAIQLGPVTCIEHGSLDTTSHADPATPPSGSAFFYLVEYHDGWSSSYGTASTTLPEVPGPGACE